MNVISIEAIFDTTKEKVWEAITNPDIMKVWYFDISNFNLSVGTEFSFYGSDGTSHLHKCKVLNFEENKFLQHTWSYPNDSKGNSVVSWNIKDVDGKVKVILTHEGIESFADSGPDFVSENFVMGWNELLKTNLRNYLYGIKKIVFTVLIKASSETIWDKMWNKKTYTEWTTPFCAGSYFEGKIELENRIHFLSPSKEGMYSDVCVLEKNKIVSFKHIGNIKDLKELPLDADSEKWTGSFETYKFEEINGITTITAEVDCVPEYINYMNDKFPLALQELKKISENK